MGFEIQFQHMVQEFGIDQHVEADDCLFFLPPDKGAADFVMDAENFKEEVLWQIRERAYFQFRTIERDLAYHATDMIFRAEVVTDKDNLARSFELVALECLVWCFCLGFTRVVCLQGHGSFPSIRTIATIFATN